MKKFAVLSFQFLVKTPKGLTACAMKVAAESGRSMLRPDSKQLLFAAFGFRFRAHGYGQREKIDEAFGVLGVVAAHGEAG